MLAARGYDHAGRRTGLTYGNGTTTSYGYDAVSRLTSLAHDVTGTAQDVTFGFAYNPAGQIYTRTTSNDAYAWGGHGSGSTTAVPDGLNRLATVGGTSFSYDTKGNLTSNGVNAYSYSAENKLASVTNPGTWSTATTMKYDPLGRLQQLNSNYSGFWAELVEDEAGQILMEYSTLSRARRYVFGPNDDEVLAQYFTSPTFNSRTWYVEDERNSVVNTGNDSGTFGTPNRYGDYGEPQSTNGGRFQYTGQYWLVEPSLLYYKNRFYDPKLGRFLQTDPTGYGAGMNMYGYVGGDPVNFIDPLGLREVCVEWRDRGRTIPTPDGGAIIEAGALHHACYDPDAPAGHLLGPGILVGPGNKLGDPPPLPNDPKPDPRRDPCGHKLPPASRTYSVPPGYRANPYDPKHQVVFNSARQRVMNPYYAAVRANSPGVNWWGVVADLSFIALSGVTGGVGGTAMSATEAGAGAVTAGTAEASELAHTPGC